MENLAGKTIVITGASGGIGSALSEACAQENARLLLCGRNEKKRAAMEKTLSEKTHTVTYSLDLRMEKSIRQCARMIKKENRNVDILIHTAAAFHVSAIESFPLSSFDEIMEVNVRGAFLFTQALLPVMKQTRGAHIIFIASVSAHRGWVGGGPYCASKRALLGLSDVLRTELYDSKIRVSVISPGQVDTNMSLLPPDHPKRLHMLKPADVARFIVSVSQLPFPMFVEEAIIRCIH